MLRKVSDAVVIFGKNPSSRGLFHQTVELLRIEELRGEPIG